MRDRARLWEEAQENGSIRLKQRNQDIQDRFNQAGVEICSPHFASLRDGNTIAIPSQYISQNYAAPPFLVNVQGEVERDKVEGAASGKR